VKPETPISKQIRECLRSCGHRVQRVQSGRVRVRGGYMHLADEGTPDLVVMSRGGVMGWIEVKTTDGTRSPEQVRFAADMKRLGIPCEVVSDPVVALRAVEGWR